MWVTPHVAQNTSDRQTACTPTRHAGELSESYFQLQVQQFASRGRMVGPKRFCNSLDFLSFWRRICGFGVE
jgi:hypothetical protein